jgi:F-type H+-transporting ATPase subunit b
VWPAERKSAYDGPMEFTPQAILYQAILFVALYFILKRLVFDRFLDNLEARHQRTKGALEEAALLREEAGRLQADYEAQMAEMRHQAAVAKDDIRRQAEKGEQELLELARGEAAQSLVKARAEIAEQVRVARASLEGDVAKLSEQVLERLLKRSS